MLTFYTNPMSRGRIIRWMLEELGEPYETVILDYGNEMNTADYLAINAMGKVPAIRLGDTVVTETAAICTWLAQRFPEKGLMAKDSAAFYRWMFFAAGPVEAAVTDAAFGLKPEAKQERSFGYGSLARVVSTLSEHFTLHDYVADNRFTAADVYVGSQVSWGLRFGTLPTTPALEAYRDRLISRRAAIRAAEIDDALVSKGQPS